MRRVPLIAVAVIPLIIGAATSIVVAWALAARESLNLTAQPAAAWPAGDQGAIVGWAYTSPGRTWRSYYFSSFAFVDPGTIRPRMGGPSKPTIPRAPDPLPAEARFIPQSNMVRISDFGLPFRCLYSVRWQDDTRGRPACRPVASRGLLHHPYRFEPLPFLPVWPGLAANTAIYAAPWCAALLLIPQLRRLRRRNRGLCERCTYDRQGLPESARCPECGHPPATRVSHGLSHIVTAWSGSPAAG